MKVAVYSRKSKLTETGDSINNQISMCKDYARARFGPCDFLEYEDEGFSGGNTERPMFKSLIRDAEKRRFDMLICYRLDRISRNVNDFSTTLELLERNNIAFVSITEQFDTSTPLGKAMLSIASVFAELERDTIAQRITDNFTELAKKGRFLTGLPPEGLAKKRMQDENGKLYNVLEAVPEEAKKIKLIYEKYLEWESNAKVEAYCFQNGIKTKAGKAIRADWITRVLTHQLYAVADARTYEYFKGLGSQIVSDIAAFDGKRGITVYRRTKRARGCHNSRNDPSGYIVGVGCHEGLISSADWIRTQNIIGQRGRLGIRKATGRYGLLNGMLRCALCGAFMRPVTIRNGSFHYKCVTKEKSRGSLCGVRNLKHTADAQVTSLVMETLGARNEFIDNLRACENRLARGNKNGTDATIRKNKQIAANEKAIEKLVTRLSETGSEALITHIAERVEKLDADTKALKKELLSLERKKLSGETRRPDPDAVKNAADSLMGVHLRDIDDTLIKRNILKTVVNSVLWDGNEITVEFAE